MAEWAGQSSHIADELAHLQGAFDRSACVYADNDQDAAAGIFDVRLDAGAVTAPGLQVSISLGEIERWDTQFHMCRWSGAEQHCRVDARYSKRIRATPHVGNWSGAASDAANRNLANLGQYLTANAIARQEAASSMGRAADEIDGVKQLLAHVKQVAVDGRFRIDASTGAVTPLDSTCDPNTLHYLTTTISRIVAAAGACDQDLAHAVNLADGIEPASATMYDGKPVYANQRQRRVG